MDFGEDVNRTIGYYIRVHYELHGRKFDWMSCYKEIKKNVPKTLYNNEMEFFNEIEEMIKDFLQSRVKYGIFMGRFQPFTNGHNETVQEMIRDGVKPFIIIGSINKNDERNPLSFRERRDLIKKVYPLGVKINGLADQDNWEDWMDSVLKLFKQEGVNPINAVIYSHVKEVDRTDFTYRGIEYKNESYTKMFQLNGIEVKDVQEKKCFLGDVIHASDIRKNESVAKRNLDARIYTELNDKFNWWK